VLTASLHKLHTSLILLINSLHNSEVSWAGQAGLEAGQCFSISGCRPKYSGAGRPAPPSTHVVGQHPEISTPPGFVTAAAAVKQRSLVAQPVTAGRENRNGKLVSRSKPFAKAHQTDRSGTSEQADL